jgi:hypothetical protein
MITLLDIAPNVNRFYKHLGGHWRTSLRMDSSGDAHNIGGGLAIWRVTNIFSTYLYTASVPTDK